MKSVDLVQPRHNYAPAPGVEKYGHIYLPTSLYAAAARLAHAGVEVKIHDENLRTLDVTSPHIGINLLGAPYFPEVIKLQNRIRLATSEEVTFILGGQVMRPSKYGLSEGQIAQLFGADAVNGNDDAALTRLLDLSPQALVRPENTSLIPIYEQISDADMKEYLSREFSFYVSQGCNQNCLFCGADKATPERYRKADVIKKDLSYLVARAITLGVSEFDIYMSNLDVIQNPIQLNQCADIVKSVRADNPGFEIKLRGLATVKFYNKFKDKYAYVIRNLVEAGFHTIGFGVDGWDNALWRQLQKGQTKDGCIEAIRSAKEDFGITPEILMVFGHDLGDSKRDTPESLEGAYAICVEMAERYGAIPRPHISKSFIPGSKGWADPQNAARVDLLIRHPEAFQCLDFTALPSPLTHPTAEIRRLATEYYLKICRVQGNTTQPVRPVAPGMSQEEIEEAKAENIGKYDR